MMMEKPTQNENAVPEAFVKNAQGEKKPLKSGLYLVATPIGNLKDITLRALEVLASVDLIACEDTRVSAKLMAAYGLKVPLCPYHDHNADYQRPMILEKIEAGACIALISDAGMPLISDPGYKLVRDAMARGLYVTSLPGANAPLMALQLSGLPSDAFVFGGFLPPKTKARQEILAKWKNAEASLIFFETAPRLEESTRDILAILGNRPMVIVRELTKKFEEVWSGQVEEICNRLEQDGPPKGEIVLVIGRSEAVSQMGDLDEMLKAEMKTLSLKDAAAKVSALLGVPKNQVYSRALELRDEE